MPTNEETVPRVPECQRGVPQGTQQGLLTRPFIETHGESHSCLDPYCPCTQAVNEGQGKICDDGAAGALTFPCPAFSATIHRRW